VAVAAPEALRAAANRNAIIRWFGESWFPPDRSRHVCYFRSCGPVGTPVAAGSAHRPWAPALVRWAKGGMATGGAVGGRQDGMGPKFASRLARRASLMICVHITGSEPSVRGAIQEEYIKPGSRLRCSSVTGRPGECGAASFSTGTAPPSPPCDDGRAGRSTPGAADTDALVAHRPRTGRRERPTAPPITSTGAFRGAPASAASIAGSSPAGLALRARSEVFPRVAVDPTIGINCPAGWRQCRPTLQWPRFAEEHRKNDCMPPHWSGIAAPLVRSRNDQLA